MAVNNNDKVVMDIAEPGRSAPDATSQPLIVGHKPLMKDTMVNSEESAAPAVEESKPVTVRADKVVAPLAPSSDGPVVDTQEEKTASPEPNTTKAETQSTLQVTSDDSAVMEALAEQAGSNKKNNTVSDEEQKQQEAIAKLIEEKTYFVPISQTERQKKTQATALLLLLLVIIVGAVLAVDAQLIDVNIDLPFDLIKN